MPSVDTFIDDRLAAGRGWFSRDEAVSAGMAPGGLASGSTFPIGVTDINCVATDVSGAATPPTNLFDITVADTTPPSVTLSG